MVQLHEVYCNELKFPGESEASSKLILILERMQGGELFQRISDLHHFTERQAVEGDYFRNSPKNTIVESGKSER